MNRFQGFNYFQLTDHEVFNQNIQTKGLAKPYAIVHNWDNNLSLKCRAAFAKFMAKTGFINAL